ncbi:MAG: MCP four helix bundle domain-containing protein [Bdellovibrionaceae bacterium]|nr:MCP four helix bundle domain-containing protein [Pseudobdellovibrionaceae bacterium]
MKNWSIGKKSYALFAALVLIILLVGGVSFYGNQQVVSKFNDFINGEFTVVKGAIILENTKDGLHASVYKAIYFSNKNEVELKNEIDLKFKFYLAEMPKQIASFDENKVSAEIKDAVQKIRPETENYAKLAEEIISFSVAGKKDQVEVKLSEFNKVYSSISDQLKVIKDLANKNIQSSKASYEHSNGFYKGINMLLIAFGFIFGSVFDLAGLNWSRFNVNLGLERGQKWQERTLKQKRSFNILELLS